MLKLDLLRLCESEGAGDVGKGLLREDNRAGADSAYRADELDVLDGFRKTLQAAAILFEEPQTRAIDLAVNQQTDETLVAEAGREGQLALRHIERSLGITEWTIVQTRHVFVGRVAHRGVVAINVECAHGSASSKQ